MSEALSGGSSFWSFQLAYIYVETLYHEKAMVKMIRIPVFSAFHDWGRASTLWVKKGASNLLAAHTWNLASVTWNGKDEKCWQPASSSPWLGEKGVPSYWSQLHRMKLTYWHLVDMRRKIISQALETLAVLTKS